MKEIAQPSKNWMTKMIEAYKKAYFEEDVDMEEFNFDNYDKPFIYSDLEDKRKCIERLFEERIERNLEWDLEDELSKSKYKGKSFTKEQIKAIKKQVYDNISSNIPLDEQLEIYADLWPHDKYRPVIL